MSRPWQMLNVDALRSAALVAEPFPYLVVDNLLRPERIAAVVESFPAMSHRGSFPLEAVSCSGGFATLMEELQSDELRGLIGERLGMDLRDRPPVVTLRGYTNERDGHIHTDSESKLVTLLLYLNPGWTDSGGRLRLLYNDRNLSPYAAEIAPEAGRCVIFRVTPNCWHGHEVFHGVRRSVQLNYVPSDAVRRRQLRQHRVSALVKGLFSRADAKRSAG